jgi:hypothetical protein
MNLTAELDSMQRWAYYGLEDDFLTKLLAEEPLVTNELTLTATELQELAALESIIESGMQTFVDVGQALITIRDQRLYRAEYHSFDDYCRDRWSFRRAHAYRLIDAAQVVSNLETADGPLPANESQARALAPLPPDQQRAAWQRVVESAPGGKITTAHIEHTVATIFDQPPTSMSQPFQLVMSQDSEEWYTPTEYITLAREVMGGIDLDPATSAIAQQWIKATVFYTIADNGLVQPWLGRTWLNPPYIKNGEWESNSEVWSNKLIAEYQAGRVTEAILLVSNKAGYNWFEHVGDQALACFARDLIRFVRPDGSRPGKAKVGSTFFYLGPNRPRFAEIFGRIGRVVTAEGNLL